MDHSSLTLTNTVSKIETEDSVSLTRASIKDALDRPQASITNEQLKKGDPVLDTYLVMEDAIPGGMGNVWRVHHNSWNVDLAMKRPQPAFFAEAGPERKKEFIAECENWINLGLHPNIVSCYYVREIGGVPTIFSEWMDKGSLKDRILDGTLYQGTKEEVRERILDIAIQALRGLMFSHEKGLIHQDMKPGNLLLSGNWDAKVADFGLAKAVSSLGEGIRNLPAGYTPAYCPAEQAEGAPVMPWMDTYAWALTVIEMIAGKRFWEKGADSEYICSRINPAPRADFSELKPDLQALQPDLSALKPDLPAPQPDLPAPQPDLQALQPDLQVLKAGLPESLFSLLKRCLLNKDVEESDAESCLLSIYREVTGNEYSRALPENFDISVDNLNNKALSMLDLNMPQEALQLWKDAAIKNHRHPEVIYNNALFLWRQAEIDGYEAYQRIKAAPLSKDRTLLLNEILRESGCDEDHFTMEIAPEFNNRDHNEYDLPGFALRPEVNDVCKYYGEEDCPKTAGPTFRKSSVCPLSGPWSCSLAELDPATAQRCRSVLGDHFLAAEDDAHIYAARRSPADWDAEYDPTGPKLLVFDKEASVLKDRLFWDDSNVPNRDLGVRQLLSFPGLSIADARLYIHVYHAAEGICDHIELGDHTLQVSYRGDLLAAGCSDGVIYVWSIPDMALLFTGNSHKRELVQLAFSHRGDMLASFDINREVRIWSVPSGRCVKTLYSSYYFIKHIAFSKDDRALIIQTYCGEWTIPVGPFTYKAPWYLSRIATTDDAIHDKQCFMERQKKAEESLSREDFAAALDWIAQARSLSGYEHDPEILALKRQIIKRLGNSEIQDMWETAAFKSPKDYSTYLALSGDSIYLLCWEKIYEYDLTGQLRRSFPSEVGEPAAVDISCDGRFLLAAGSVNFIESVNSVDAAGSVDSVGAAGSGKSQGPVKLFSSLKKKADKGYRVCVHDLTDGHVMNTLFFPCMPFCIAFDQTAGMFAVGGKNALEIYSFPSCRRIWKKSLKCMAVSWNKDAPVLYALCFDSDNQKSMRIITVNGFLGTRIRKKSIGSSLLHLFPTVSPDGRLCVYDRTRGFEHFLICEEFENNEKLREVEITAGVPDRCAYTKDSRFIAIGTSAGSIGIYNCETLKREPNLREDTLPKHELGQIAWNDDSSALVCTSWVKQKDTICMDVHAFYVDWKT